MESPVEQQTFDAGERELIRKKLISYMKENGIGAPKLAKRIKTSHRLDTPIPVSTLQRFLANRMRTNEVFVRFCHRFVEHLTISDPIAKLGERLSIFYGTGNGHDYSGNYISAPSLGDKFDDNIEIVADAGFWRFTERTSLHRGHAIYDGVLVSAGNDAVVVLKDRLAGRARNYMLWAQDKYLYGQGVTQSVCFLSSDVHRPFKLDSIGISLRKQ